MQSKHTKNDIDAEKVTIDYYALEQTAAFAFRELREQCNRYVTELYKPVIDETRIQLNAEWLANTARELSIAVDTYITILAARKDRKIKFTGI